MRTTLPKEVFYQQVQLCNRFLPIRPNLPVLNNFLIEAKGTKLFLSVTNLETSLKIEAAAKNDGDWETTVPGRVLAEFMSQAKGEKVELEQEKEKLKVVAPDFKASIATIAAGEFPHLPQPKTKGEEYPTKDLYQTIAQVAFSASKDEGKPVLGGILLKRGKEDTLVVATDGYRLAKKILKNTFNFDQIIVPSKTLVEGLKVANELGEEKIKLTLAEEENQLFITGANFSLASRMLDGVYPQFEQIIPHQFVTEVRVEKEDFVSALKAAAVFAKDIGNVVKIAVSKNGLEIEADTAQVGQGLANLATQVSGDAIKVAFNSHYLLEGLSVLQGEKISLSFSGSLSPACLESDKDEGFTYIVMPVKVQN